MGCHTGASQWSDHGGEKRCVRLPNGYRYRGEQSNGFLMDSEKNAPCFCVCSCVVSEGHICVIYDIHVHRYVLCIHDTYNIYVPPQTVYLNFQMS